MKKVDDLMAGEMLFLYDVTCGFYMTSGPVLLFCIVFIYLIFECDLRVLPVEKISSEKKC